MTIDLIASICFSASSPTVDEQADADKLHSKLSVGCQPVGPLDCYYVVYFLLFRYKLSSLGVCPSRAARSKVLPGVTVDIKGLHLRLTNISVAKLGVTCISFCHLHASRRCFLGIRPSSKRRTWPSYLSRVNMVVRLTRDKTSMLWTFFHDMPRMREIYFKWTVFSLFSYLTYRPHVLTAEAL